MTQEEIIEMAREAGFFVKDNDAYSPSVQEDHELTPFLLAFANLVAARDYERGFIDGMQKQMQSSVDKAVNAMSQRPWVGLTDEEIAQGCKESWVTEQAFQSAVWWAEAKLKEKNSA